MYNFEIKKADLNNNFTGINTNTLGTAVGELKHCGLKLYLYLAGNKNGSYWTLNPSVYATWLGKNYDDASSSRAVRKAINDGIDDLIARGYLQKMDDNHFIFVEQGNLKNEEKNNDILEQKVPENVEKNNKLVEQKVPKKEYKIISSMEQKVPSKVIENVNKMEQKVPNDFIF